MSSEASVQVFVNVVIDGIFDTEHPLLDRWCYGTPFEFVTVTSDLDEYFSRKGSGSRFRVLRHPVAQFMCRTVYAFVFCHRSELWLPVASNYANK